MKAIKPPSLASLKFDYVNSNIESIDLLPVRNTDFRVFDIDTQKSSEEVAALIEAAGYAPATLSELLCYAKDGWDGKDWVVALGQVAHVDGDRRVPYLAEGSSGRDLFLYWWVGGWDSHVRFLAVRSVSPSSESGPLDALTLIREIEERLGELKKLV